MSVTQKQSEPTTAIDYRARRRWRRRYWRLQRERPAPAIVTGARRYGRGVLLFAGAITSTFALLALVGGIFGAVAVAEYLRVIPTPEQQLPAAAFLSSKVYANDGQSLLYEIVDPQGGSRTLIPLHDMPVALLEATIVTEDADFFEHPGFDPKSILRAIYQNTSEQRVISGASTITQQLARNILINANQRYQVSYLRKVTEAVLAYRLTLRFERDEILEKYLNEIFYGNLSYGVEAAAQGYFGKSARDLTLAESAFLAGLVQAPSYYDPLTNLPAARDRQAYVLDRMVAEGMITGEEAAAARAEPLRFATKRFDLRAPHFVFLAKDTLTDLFGESIVLRDGLTVTTTLDMAYQEAAERVLSNSRDALREAGANNATLVALDVETGGILAMVGSLDYNDAAIAGQVNQALVARQSGPVLTPFLLAASFEQGRTPITTVIDEPVNIADGQWFWVPRNPDGQYRGELPLRAAFEQELLAPFVRMLREDGGDHFAEFVRRIGVHQLRRQFAYDPDLLVRDGFAPPLDIAVAYATIARGGVLREATPIRHVRGPEGEGLYDITLEPQTLVMSATSAYLTTDLLTRRVAQRGVAGAVPTDLRHQPLAVEWGQSEDQRDTWVVGYTPRVVVVLWVGNTNGEPTSGATALQVASATWLDYVSEVLGDTPAQPFDRPRDIVDAEICVDSACSQTVREVFALGTEITEERDRLRRAAPTPTSVALPNQAGQTSAALVHVPNLAGLSVTDATRTLIQAGLRPASVHRVHLAPDQSAPGQSTALTGQVTGTIPAAGDRVPSGTTVQLVVSQRNDE